MNTVELIFTRHEGMKGITSLAIAQLEMDEIFDENETLNRLKEAVTNWVNETEEGRKLWDYSCEDLNIGDLAACASREDLIPYLKKAGIKDFNFLFCGDVSSGAHSFDTVLASSHS